MSYVAYCPTGTIFAFGGTNAPSGWLICDGSAVSRTTYAQLFAAISTANGSGDGSTTFNIPDFRGRFLRGVDGASSRDPDKTSRIAMNTGGNTGNAVGSVQGLATSISSGTQSGTKSTAGLANASSSVSATGTAASAGSHFHNFTAYDDERFPSVYAVGGATGNAQNITTDTQGAHTHSVSVSGTANAQTITGDNETRPINAYVNYIIKV